MKIYKYILNAMSVKDMKCRYTLLANRPHILVEGGGLKFNGKNNGDVYYDILSDKHTHRFSDPFEPFLFINKFGLQEISVESLSEEHKLVLFKYLMES
jgi:hypothetical protein